MKKICLLLAAVTCCICIPDTVYATRTGPTRKEGKQARHIALKSARRLAAINSLQSKARTDARPIATPLMNSAELQAANSMLQSLEEMPHGHSLTRYRRIAPSRVNLVLSVALMTMLLAQPTQAGPLDHKLGYLADAADSFFQWSMVHPLTAKLTMAGTSILTKAGIGAATGATVAGGGAVPGFFSGAIYGIIGELKGLSVGTVVDAVAGNQVRGGIEWGIDKVSPVWTYLDSCLNERQLKSLTKGGGTVAFMVLDSAVAAKKMSIIIPAESVSLNGFKHEIAGLAQHPLKAMGETILEQKNEIPDLIKRAIKYPFKKALASGMPEAASTLTEAGTHFSYEAPIRALLTATAWSKTTFQSLNQAPSFVAYGLINYAPTAYWSPNFMQETNQFVQHYVYGHSQQGSFDPSYWYRSTAAGPYDNYVGQAGRDWYFEQQRQRRGW